MLKRIFILVFILSAVVLLAMAPMSTPATSENTHKLQETMEVPDVGITLEVDVTNSDSEGGLPNNTLVYALVAIIAIAVVIGGVALISKRQ
jgi:hypothetical protein